MRITTAKKGKDKMLDYLFSGPRTPTRIGKFDLGKYKWTGKASDYVGREVPDIDGIVSVWVERRQDKDGPYAQLMSLSFDE